MRFAAFLLALSAVAANAASFDCVKARSETEKMICGNAELIKLDEDLARAYARATANPADREFVREWQRTWLSAREACGAPDCMKPAYVAQISDLNERAERGATTTGFSGKYERYVNGKRDSHTSRLTVVELKGDRVRVFGTSVWVSNAAIGAVNVGEISGLARVMGNRIAYTDADNEECKFVITFTGKGLKVGEDKLQCGGHNVTFTGEYRRVGALK